MTLVARAAARAWAPHDARGRRVLLTILAVAFALRLVWVLYAGREPQGFGAGDPLAYLYYGNELAAGHGYRSFLTGAPTAFYPIGYPLFIALFAWPAQHGLLPDDVTRLVGVAQVVLGTATVLFVWVVANRLFGTRTALVAAALTACWPGLILLTASLNLETVFVALLLGALAVLMGRPGDAPPSVRRLLVAGTLLGFSALVRPFSLPVLGAVFVGYAVARPRNLRTALRATAWLALPVVLVLAPWVARNEREMGTFALSTNTGDTLCLDHTEGAVGYFRFPPECFAGFDDVAPQDLERVRNDEDTRRALRFVREHPATEAKLIVKRARYMIDGDHDGLLGVEANGSRPFLPSALRTTLRTTADWWYLLTLALAIVSVPMFLSRRRRRRADRLVVALTAAVLIAIPLELYGYSRFHVPWIPFQAMGAALSIVYVHDRLSRRQERPHLSR